MAVSIDNRAMKSTQSVLNIGLPGGRLLQVCSQGVRQPPGQSSQTSLLVLDSGPVGLAQVQDTVSK